MPAINLKDFFCRYTTDKFIDVSEKGPEELRTDKRYEATQSIRITYAPWALFRWKSRNGMIHRPCRSPKLHSLFYGTPPKALFRLFLMCRQHKKASENRIKHKKTPIDA